MSHRFKLIDARYTQGLAAYRAGHSIRDAVHITEAIEEMHEEPDLTNEQHDEIAASTPSFILGFAEGFLEDVRSVIRTSPRRGPSA